MPELPEVEVVVRALKSKMINRVVTNISIFYESIIGQRIIFEKILNKIFLDIYRKGKYLVFFLSDNLVLVGHLRMEGKINIEHVDACTTVDRHEHFRLFLDNDTVFRYYDFRKFGRFLLYNKHNYLSESKLDQLALDPFLILAKDFYQRLQKTNVMIKKVLLNQKFISGIGNIYASEVLFLSKIHPETPACHLTLKQVELLLKKAQAILTESISLGGTTVNTFESLGIKGLFQKKLLVYNKKKENCCFCQQEIKKINIDGRSSYFCSFCQKYNSKE
ncbi:DNA-formamidopyrimidine glycosylase [Candidatus Phytoplasma melaleucae]|uniref:DNA-formamidopyrimidine glycosylase n=1 Tax=Candidatus Phytoplasma melaleucae TaxID=2982630 RepID=A0ABT9DF72_9MOLU|nr:DNA-formamidopyrimidine glycosylase ['Melaleuca sp.' phytoplasma]MDO8167904.1 DNA-formamidopyrimidine glycosylase ['Melaleuca sp.' phytoplasma]MDV3205189.1 DNA-formamidopyrimidine glycosylase [Weeping tea tree witches'-broom phytoplasma]